MTPPLPLKVALPKGRLLEPSLALFRRIGIAVAEPTTTRKLLVPSSDGALSFLFVKPADLGSSIGVTKAHDRTEFVGAIEEALRYDDHLVIEHGGTRPESPTPVAVAQDDDVVGAAGAIIVSDEQAPERRSQGGEEWKSGGVGEWESGGMEV